MSGGVKTQAGKAISKMNAYKHGRYSKEIREASQLITRYKQVLREINEIIN